MILPNQYGHDTSLLAQEEDEDLAQDGDEDLAQDGDEDLIFTGYIPAPFVTSDFKLGDDVPVEPNPITLARLNSKKSRKLKKTNMQKDLKAYESKEKIAVRLKKKKDREKEQDDKKARALLKKDSTKSKKHTSVANVGEESQQQAPKIKKARSRTKPVTPNPEEHNADADDGVQLQQELQQQAPKIKKARSHTKPVTPNPEEHNADADDGVQLQQELQQQAQTIKHRKLEEHQDQKRQPKANQKQTRELQLFDDMIRHMCKWNVDVHRKNSGEGRGLGIFSLR